MLRALKPSFFIICSLLGFLHLQAVPELQIDSNWVSTTDPYGDNTQLIGGNLFVTANWQNFGVWEFDPINGIQQIGQLENSPALSDTPFIRGNLLLYVNSHEELITIDISDPTNPILESQVYIPVETIYSPNRHYIIGNQLFLFGRDTMSADRLFNIYDISDPGNPILTGSQVTTRYIRGVGQSNGRLVVGDDNNIRVFDTSNPQALVEEITLNIPSLATIRCEGDRVLARDRDLMYHVIDISSPEPAINSSFNMDPDTRSSNLYGDFAVGYSYITGELGSEKLTIYNLRDAANPVISDTYTDILAVLDLSINGSNILIGGGQDGISVFDLSPEGLVSFNVKTEQTDMAMGMDQLGDTLYVANGFRGITVLQYTDGEFTLDKEIPFNYARDISVASEYALVRDGLFKEHVIDIHNAEPSVVASLDTATNIFKSEIIGNRALTIGEGIFTIYDMTDFRNPVMVHRIEGLRYEVEFFVDGDYVYFPSRNDPLSRLFIGTDTTWQIETADEGLDPYSIPRGNQMEFTPKGNFLVYGSEWFPMDLSSWPVPAYGEPIYLDRGTLSYDSENELFWFNRDHSIVSLYDARDQFDPDSRILSSGFAVDDMITVSNGFFATISTGGVIATSIGGTIDLDVNVIGLGTVTSSLGSTSIPWDTPVTLTAIGESGYSFQKWAGDVDPGRETENPITILTRKAQSYTAVFVPPVEFIKIPDETVALIGDTVTWSLDIRAPASSTFQWYKNNELIEGETNLTLTLDNVSNADSGSYHLEVTAPGNSTLNSSSIQLSVRSYSFNLEYVTPGIWDTLEGSVIAFKNGILVERNDSHSVNLFHCSYEAFEYITTLPFDGAVYSANFSNQYLAVSGEFGTHFFDISAPHLPDFIGQISSTGFNSFIIRSGYAITCDSNGLKSWSFNHPEQSIGSLGLGIPDYYELVEKDDVAYIPIKNTANALLVSLKNPQNLYIIKTYPYHADNIIWHGDQLVLFNRSLGCEILDTTDPENPVSVGTVTTDQAHSRVSSLGRYILLWGSDIQLWDTEIPENPISVYESEMSYGLYNKYSLVGRYLISWSSDFDLDFLADIQIKLTTQKGPGTIDIGTDQREFPAGTQVTASATPDPGYLFYKWTGLVPDGLAQTNPLPYPLLADGRLSAVFLADPTILKHPQGQIALTGDSIRLTVDAIGGTPVSYQWRKDGEPLDGFNDKEIVLSDISKDHEGVYDVVVSSQAGSLISDSAEILVAGSFASTHLSTVAANGIPRLSGKWLIVPDAEGIALYDISEPAFPVFSHSVPLHDGRDFRLSKNGKLATYRTHDQVYIYTIDQETGIQEVASMSFDHALDRVEINGNTLFAISWATKLESIWDISNPAQPTLVSDSHTIGLGEYWAQDFDATYLEKGNIRRFDFSDQEDPQEILSFEKQWGTTVGIELANDYLYVAMNELLQVFDVTDRNSPVEVTTLSFAEDIIQIKATGNIVYLMYRGDGFTGTKVYKNTGVPESPIELLAELTPLPFDPYRDVRGFDVSGSTIVYGGYSRSGIHLFDLRDIAHLGLQARGHGKFSNTGGESRDFLPGSQVTLEAIPDEGYYFSHWAGDIPEQIIKGTGNTYNQNHWGQNPVQLQLDDDMGLLGIFYPNPTIHLQPKNQLAIAGDTVHFPVVARGGENITFQWQKDGIDIPGATSESLQLASVTVNDSGNYQLIATCDGFSTTSIAANLSVVHSLNLHEKTYHQISGRDLTVKLPWLYFLSTKLEIVDFSDPDSPVLTEGIPGVSSYCFVGEYLYTSGEGMPLSVWNVNDPSNPVLVSEITQDDLPLRASIHSTILHPFSNILVANSKNQPPVYGHEEMVNVYDTSDPANPKFLSCSYGETLKYFLDIGEVGTLQNSWESNYMVDFQNPGEFTRLAKVPEKGIIPYGNGYYVILSSYMPNKINYYDFSNWNEPIITSGLLEDGFDQFTRWGNYGNSVSTKNGESILLKFGGTGLPQIFDRGDFPDLTDGKILDSKLYRFAWGSYLTVIDLSALPELELVPGLNGSVSANPDTGGIYAHNQSVEISAVPEEGYLFSHWSGDVSDSEKILNPLTITMDSDRSIKAVFLPELSLLSSPMDKMARFGDTISFQFEYHGDESSTIQWYHNNQPIEGANQKVLQLFINNWDLNGTYHAIISNGTEYLTTRPAKLDLVYWFMPMIRQDLAGITSGITSFIDNSHIRTTTVDTYSVYDQTLADPKKAITQIPVPFPAVNSWQSENNVFFSGNRIGEYMMIDESDIVNPIVNEDIDALPKPVWDKYAYSIPYGGSFEIFDVSDPVNPVMVNTVQPEYMRNAAVLGAAKGYLYVINYYEYLHVYSLEDPVNPQFVASIGNRFKFRHMHVTENYILSGDRSWLEVYSLENPAEPTLTSSIELGEDLYAITTSGPYVFVALDHGGLSLYKINSNLSIEQESLFANAGYLDRHRYYRDLKMDGSTLYATDRLTSELLAYQMSAEIDLDLETQGDGTISLSKEGPYPPGDSIELTAEASSNMKFSHWEIDESRIHRPENPLILSMWDHHRVRAVFYPDEDADLLPDDWEVSQYGGMEMSHDTVLPGDGLNPGMRYFFGLDPENSGPVEETPVRIFIEEGSFYLEYKMREGTGAFSSTIVGSDNLDSSSYQLIEDVHYVTEDILYHGDGTRDIVLRFISDPPRFIYVHWLPI